MRGLPDSLAVLRERDYRLLFSGYAASLLGDGMVSVALAFAVLHLGGSASEVGLVFAARTLALVACLLAGGVVADRVSRRSVMVAADLARLFSQGVLALLLVTGEAHIWMIAVLTAITGAATGFFNPASTGLLPLVVKPEQLQQANGLRSTTQAVGEILGPAIAGLLVVAASPGWALAIDAATFAISAAFLSGIHVPPGESMPKNRFLADLRGGWSAFTERTWVWSSVLAFSITNAAWGAWSALGPVIAERHLGGAAAWGSVLAAMGAGGVVGGMAAIRARPRRPLMVVVPTAMVFALPLALLASHASVPLLACSTFLAGVSLMYGNSIWESTLQRHIPPESLSRVSAYDWFGSLVFQPLGLALWGPIAGWIGIDTALWIAFAVWTTVILAMFAVPDIRRVTDDDRAASPVPEPAVQP
ncbi:MFS transporter [Candidatus Solirubrobacter pratensis]|uniref:MFS transporter n=1 Tax=Candidatus Solirubrobacter pratensis TaxID=1298857 RepID=UPI00040071AC|nr:MFS transporter [Candidatus Solirubrobacter pratensis]